MMNIAQIRTNMANKLGSAEAEASLKVIEAQAWESVFKKTGSEIEADKAASMAVAGALIGWFLRQ